MTFPDGDGFGTIPGPDRTYNGGPTDAFVAKISETIDVLPPELDIPLLPPDLSKQFRFSLFIRDLGSGLAGIQIDPQRTTNNVQVTGIANFPQGTNDPVEAVVTLLAPEALTRLGLQVADVAGNVNHWDLIGVGVQRQAGYPMSTPVPALLPAEQHWVTLFNGEPGLTDLEIQVNGQVMQVAGLRPREVRRIDVSAAMQPKDTDNRVMLTPLGLPGVMAVVLIHD